MKRMTWIAVLLPVFIAGFASAQDQSEIQDILDRIGSLEARVLSLEQENAELRAEFNDLKASLEGGDSEDMDIGEHPVFILEEVRSYEPANERAEMSRLRVELANAEQSIESASQKIDAHRKYNSKHRTGGPRLSSDELARQQYILGSSQREAAKLRVAMARTQRSIDTPRFWLMGWDGEQDIMLVTTKDETKIVKDLKPGTPIQWIGEVADVGAVDGDRRYQTAEAKFIRVIYREIENRPEERKAVWAPVVTAKAEKVAAFPRLPRK